ncbi:MAG: dihydroorotate dehydrogenase electron transfer subunit [Bacteroidales bacterium]|jgi:dihydroorotate dehydrogenase electron transfer subunit|nr:dihydroorotate dehydrogenase electron transfer subunit [Bacteroidales bacterium]
MVFKKNIGDLTVIRNLRLNQRHFLLELQSEKPFPVMLPGQFVQAFVKDAPVTFLRRPFSIHAVNFTQNILKLLIQIKGEGTRHLSTLREGEKLNLIFPLGNSFTIPHTKEVLLIGGGCGVAPLLFLAQFLNQQQIKPSILLGFRTKDDIFEIEEYSRYGKVFISTDDGSEGEKGLVVDHSLFQKERLPFKKIYCCGPEAMMKFVDRIAKFHHIDCEVSLENTMACGFGVCLCCIAPTDKGNERVCTEGPVFNTKRLAGW